MVLGFNQDYINVVQQDFPLAPQEQGNLVLIAIAILRSAHQNDVLKFIYGERKTESTQTYTQLADEPNQEKLRQMGMSSSTAASAKEAVKTKIKGFRSGK